MQLGIGLGKACGRGAWNTHLTCPLVGSAECKFYKHLYWLRILPCAFILIGLFEVWVKRETVERHFGEKSGFKGYIWAILLAGTTVGGIFVAFPIAYALYSKGARLSVIFTLVSASAICRIPMALFEASFLGVKFTAIRILVSLPLVIVTSMLLGNYLTKKNYTLSQPPASF